VDVESGAPLAGGESQEAVSTDVVAGDTAAAGIATSAACSVLRSSSGQIALSLQSSATAVSIHFCTTKAHYRTCFAVPAASSRTCTVLFLSCLRICNHCTQYHNWLSDAKYRSSCSCTLSVHYSPLSQQR
jgi:hypothetical protein